MTTKKFDYLELDNTINDVQKIALTLLALADGKDAEISGKVVGWLGEQLSSAGEQLWEQLNAYCNDIHAERSNSGRTAA